MIFSLVQNNKSMLFSLLVSDYFGCFHCFPNKCRSHFSILNFSKFSVSEQYYQVLVCIFFFFFFFFFAQLECKEHLVTGIL